MAEHVVRDGLARIKFIGDQLAAVSTETTVQPRWIELELYRVDQAPPGYEGRYYIHTIGRSVVFHVRDSTCNTGIPIPLGQLPDDAEPCPRCQPDVRLIRVPGTTDTFEWVGPADRVDLESDRHTTHPCKTASDVVTQLEGKSGPAKGKLSAPAQRLLEIAALADEDIADAIIINVTETF